MELAADVFVELGEDFGKIDGQRPAAIGTQAGRLVALADSARAGRVDDEVVARADRLPARSSRAKPRAPEDGGALNDR